VTTTASRLLVALVLALGLLAAPTPGGAQAATGRPLAGHVLVVATWNTGAGGGAPALRRLLRTADVIAAQEWGDRDSLRRVARRHGWRVIDGRRPGQTKTPLLYDPAALHLRHRIARHLVGPAWVGPGAGRSDRMGPKWAIGGRFGFHGRAVVVASTHVLPSLYRPRRRAMGAAHVRRLVATMGGPGARFIAGDFNATPGHPVLRPLPAAGWTHTHRTRLLPTHGRRAIDFVWWKRRPGVRLLDVRTMPNGSDHHALIATYRIH
jgi:hypothetical protein